MAFRVQRSENTLNNVAAHLYTLVEQSALREAIGTIRDHIGKRRRDVTELRRMTTIRAGQPSEVRGLARSGEPETEGQEVVVWFGTNRAHDARGKFVGRRGDQVQYGRCKVYVPSNRNMGSLGSGWFKRIFRGDDRIKVVRTEKLLSNDFWSEIAREFQVIDASDRHGLIYLHGYNVKFDDAARRTAQLKVDLDFRGTAAFFSWPSLGIPQWYPNDEAAIEASEAAIRDFLVDFAGRSGAQAVHVIAHSMGNRGLLRAMDVIARDATTRSRMRFGQVILAAPDVDRHVFENLASAYVALAQRSTLYISENDKAIGLSARLHGFDRVGLAPPVAIVPGIDTVNVSRINLDFMGHSHAQLRPVLGDIHQLISANTPPAKRFGLREAGAPNLRHWVFV